MDNQDTTARRSYLKLTGSLGAGLIVGVSGCLGDDDDGGPAAAQADDEDEAVEDEEVEDENGQEAIDEEFEIVHWWTAGGEEDALNALLEGYQEEYPDVEIDNNPAPGGAGSALDAAVRSRIVDQTPPSTFQIWPGEALRPYTDEQVLESVEDIWTDEMREAYLESVMEAARPEDDLVSVPLNIHRLNSLFYNVDVVEEIGVDPEGLESPEDLLEAFQTAEDEGYTGLAQQTTEPWGVLQLWETVFIGQHGVDAFEQYVEGDTEDVEDEIRESLELVEEYSDYYSPDAGAIAWDEANAQVIDGEAAFHHQGDWAAGQYEAADLEYGEEWDHVPFPGTDEVYSIVMDSFVMPTNNPSPAATEAFLEYVGTVDAQERFNPPKGSIPPRTDVPTDDFPPFQQDQMDDFEASAEQPTTIGHGSAVRPEISSEIEEVFARFLETGDVDDTTDGLVNAHSAAGF